MRRWYLLALFLFASNAAADIVALRTIWCGDGLAETVDELHRLCGEERPVTMPEVKDPINMEYTQLVRFVDGQVQILVDPGFDAAVDSPSISLDAQWVYYALCVGVLDKQADSCNLQRYRLPDGPVEAITTGPGYKMHPAEYQPGKLVYVTDELRIRPSKRFTEPGMQLAVIDLASGAHEVIGFHSIGSALHPLPLTDGHIAYSSYESQGYRDRRLWGLWAIRPDGTGWFPLLSALSGRPDAYHFSTQLTGGRLATAVYYNQNNYGFGTVVESFAPSTARNAPFFLSYQGQHNPTIPWGCHAKGKPSFDISIPFQPTHFRNLFQFTNARDNAGCKLGKVSHPGAAKGNALMVTYSPGPVNGLSRPTSRPFPQMGVYLLASRAGVTGAELPVATHPSELRLILDDPHWNEYYAREVASFDEMHGKPAPALISGEDSPRAEPGEPFGFIGSSSTCHQSVEPGRAKQNMSQQGAAIQPYDCDSIVGMRVVVMEGTPNDRKFDWRQYPTGRRTHYQERLRILGEIPIEADGSWLAKVPANMAIGFGPIDRAGQMLAAFGTWKQVRPHEDRHDCGGCHAHDRVPIPFEGTLADNNRSIPDVATQTPLMEADGTLVHEQRVMDVEFADTRLDDYDKAIALVDYLDAKALIKTVPENLHRTIYRWVSLGAPKDEGGWFRDDQPPVIALKTVGETLYIGAYDTRDDVEPRVSINGNPAALLQAGRFRWKVSPFSGGLVRVQVSDSKRNSATLVRYMQTPPDIIGNTSGNSDRAG